MTLLSSYQAAVGGVITILIYGIIVEKHYVSRSTVFSNLLSFILLLASIEISYYLLSGLILYIILGVLVMKHRVKIFYPAFGARAYGSLALILLLQGERLIPGIDGRGPRETIFLLVLFWVALTMIVHLIGYIYKKHGWKLFGNF